MPASSNTSSASAAGPDFAFGAIKDLQCDFGSDGSITLSDNSVWRVDVTKRNYDAVCNTAKMLFERRKPILISGDRASGVVGFVSIPRALAVNRISDSAEAGGLDVTFHGPPSIYHLDRRRPWYDGAAMLLKKSAASGSFLDSPDLMVSVDTLTNEILDVRPLEADQ